MKAIGKNVIIARAPLKTQTDGGIHIPETARKSEATGEVVSAGQEATHVKEGQEVLYLTVGERVVGEREGLDLVLVPQDVILVVLKD